MSNTRELSQLASLLVVNDETRNIGIGTTNPIAKLDVGGNLNVSGIITSTGGFNIGIQSAGTNVTTGVITALNFVGAGNTFNYNTGTKTVDISIAGGSGGSQVSVGTEAPVGPTSGDLWYNADYARIFVYYDNGINSQWVDAAPFNFGIITSLEGLTVTGILTATSGFSGNLTGTATGLSGTPNITVGIITATSFVGSGANLTGIANTANIVSTAITTGTLNTNTFTATGQSIINRVAISTVGVNTTLQTGRTYVYFVGVTSLTLPPSPVVGDTLKIINRSGITTAIILRNGSNIMGDADDLEFDQLDGNFTFTFTNSSEGWTIG